MSYCVNCGVELSQGVLKCPLCDTPVINPNIINLNKKESPFPEKIELPKTSKNKYSAIIMSIVLLIPNIVCILTNILFTPNNLWSIYVVSSSALFWFLFVFPFLMKQKKQYLIIAIDAIATAAYIYIFYYKSVVETDSFWRIALPLVVGAYIIVTALCAYFSKKRTLTKKLITAFATLTAVNVYVCAVINLYSFSVIGTYITMILGVSCLIFLIFFIAAERNYKLRAWLSRKFFF